MKVTVWVCQGSGEMDGRYIAEVFATLDEAKAAAADGISPYLLEDWQPNEKGGWTAHDAHRFFFYELTPYTFNVDDLEAVV